MIIAVDPGGTSGIVSVYGPGNLDTFLPEQAEGRRAVRDTVRGLMRGPGRFGGGAGQTWERFGRNALVVEKYTITVETAKLSAQPDALLITGALEGYAHDDGWDFDGSQKPSEAKSIFTDRVLKHLGWYTPGLGHANDAARHLGLFLLRADNETIKEALLNA